MLAPTGTIGFMMDCDTTGIEPDIALVKYKKLVGGGVLKIVNNTVPLALQRLGYSPEAIHGVLQHIDEMETIEGARGPLARAPPGLRLRLQAGQRRALHPLHGAHPDDGGGAALPLRRHLQDRQHAARRHAGGHRARLPRGLALGLKAIAVYRDGCKRSQPLNTGAAKAEEAAPPAPERLARRRLPDERRSITHKFSIGGHEGYLTVGMYDDGTPGELFVTMAKEGSVVSGLMDNFATSISMALQYGVPMKVLCDKFSHTRFEPSGFTGNADIPIAKSITDYLFRWLALKFLPREDAQQMDASRKELPPGAAPQGLKRAAAQATVELVLPPVARQPTPGEVVITQGIQNQQDAPPCPTCGCITIRNGACYKCTNCGGTTGCS